MTASLVNAIRLLATNGEGAFRLSPDSEVVSQLKSIEAQQLRLLPSKGLAHDHICIAGTDLLLRIPKQSQMRLSALDNLEYQVACFERMRASMHTPICYALIPPTAELQMGALLVQRIYGRHVQSADDFHSIAEALASIHRLPLIQDKARMPLLNQSNPMLETLVEVESQAQYLAQASMSQRSLDMIRAELKQAKSDVNNLALPPTSLISFDAHPGNFLIDKEGKAILVDLEKARYSGAGFDLAHASLYTSTTWDRDININLGEDDLHAFYNRWMIEVEDELASASKIFFIPMRRLMWLWSVTWCSKWKVESQLTALESKHTADNTEDWASDNNPEELVHHVDERVNHYLLSDVIEKIRAEFYPD